MISAQSGAVCAKVTMRRWQARRAASRLVEYTIRGPIAPGNQMSLSVALEPLEPEVDDDVGADLAAQRDHRRDFFEVEDVDRLAADLAQHHVVGGDSPTVDITPRFQRLRMSVDSRS